MKPSWLIGLVLGMLGLSYASVPLYRIFCQKTGFGGTPKLALTTSKQAALGPPICVQFTATTHRKLPWVFYPLQSSVTVRAGANAIAYFHFENKSDKPITGMATYNISPDRAGSFFNKVECFCFEQQRLEPGQAVDMPVLFFIDRDIATDPTTKDIKTVTLAYTFFEYKGQRPKPPSSYKVKQKA